VHRDPEARARPDRFIQRNTPHLFGAGGVQRLAEEMTRTCAQGPAGHRQLRRPRLHRHRHPDHQGVNFGTVVITRAAPGPIPSPPNNCIGTDAIPFIDPPTAWPGVTADITGLQGIGRDLVVRGFQWKGRIAFIRDFNRDASNQEIGMQSVEMAGENATATSTA
jgi:hypothetical protein